MQPTVFPSHLCCDCNSVSRETESDENGSVISDSGPVNDGAVSPAPCSGPAGPAPDSGGGLKPTSLPVRFTRVRSQAAAAPAERTVFVPDKQLTVVGCGSVSAAPGSSITVTVNGGRGRQRCRGRLLPTPSSHFIVGNLCQGCSLSGERRPCALELQMGKNNTAHIILTLLQQIQKNARRTSAAAPWRFSTNTRCFY